MHSCSIAKASRGDVSWASCLEAYDCREQWTWSNWHNTPRGRMVFLSQMLPARGLLKVPLAQGAPSLEPLGPSGPHKGCSGGRGGLLRNPE
eukprot:6609791-Pyramimonas_sp.AAC.1